jgi:hypothetical protein
MGAKPWAGLPTLQIWRSAPRFLKWGGPGNGHASGMPLQRMDVAKSRDAARMGACATEITGHRGRWAAASGWARGGWEVVRVVRGIVGFIPERSSTCQPKASAR